MTWKRINEQLGVGEKYGLCVRLITLCAAKYSNILGGAPESSDKIFVTSRLTFVGTSPFATSVVYTESLMYFMTCDISYIIFVYSIFMIHYVNQLI